MSLPLLAKGPILGHTNFHQQSNLHFARIVGEQSRRSVRTLPVVLARLVRVAPVVLVALATNMGKETNAAEGFSEGLAAELKADLGPGLDGRYLP